MEVWKKPENSIPGFFLIHLFLGGFHIVYGNLSTQKLKRKENEHVMWYLHTTAAIPNRLITDTDVHYTTKRLAATLLFLRGRNQTYVRVTMSDLARLSGLSKATVQQGIRELVAQKYIIKNRRYRYSDTAHSLIYDTNDYSFLPVEGGYTIVRREIMECRVTAAAFTVLLFLYYKARQSGRAFPSLRHIAGLLRETAKAGLAMAKSTVCVAVRALRSVCLVIRLCCKTKQGCYAASSYLLTYEKSTSKNSCALGSPIFSTPRIIKQITRELNDYKSYEGKYKDNSIIVIMPKYERSTIDGKRNLSVCDGQYKFDLWAKNDAYMPKANPPPMRC